MTQNGVIITRSMLCQTMFRQSTPNETSIESSTYAAGRTLALRHAVARGTYLIGATVLSISLGLTGLSAFGQQPPVASFKAGVDMVRVAAVVRDQKGRFVRDLTARD